GQARLLLAAALLRGQAASLLGGARGDGLTQPALLLGPLALQLGLAALLLAAGVDGLAPLPARLRGRGHRLLALLAGLGRPAGATARPRPGSSSAPPRIWSGPGAASPRRSAPPRAPASPGAPAPAPRPPWPPPPGPAPSRGARPPAAPSPFRRWPDRRSGP